MKYFSFIKSLFIFLVSVFVVVIVAPSFRIIQFHYPRAIENDPLLSPFKVQSVSGSTLRLEDGRTFTIDTFDEPLDQIVKESGFRIDVDSEAGASDAMLFVKRRGWICGTPWTALIEIPLIPDNVPINRRQPIGIATLVPDTSPKGD